MARVTVEARLSASRKYAVCGACGRSLCRRDRIVDDAWPDSPPVHHELIWDTDWRREGGHLERSASALARLDRGDAPVRRGTLRGWPGHKQALVFPDHPPAVCPWAACDALNTIDPRRLDVYPR